MPAQRVKSRQIPLGEAARLSYKGSLRGARPAGPAPQLFLRRVRKTRRGAGAVEGMINPFQFLQEVRSEAAKIVWPVRRETLITSGLVILMVLFASLFFLIVDQGLRLSLGLLLRIGR